MNLRYTPEAIADLRNTKEYVSDVLHNPKAANRIVKQILDMCSKLKDYPDLGMLLSAKTGEETDLKYLVCDHHLALYRVEGDWIMVVRILDGRTDYMRLLFR